VSVVGWWPLLLLCPLLMQSLVLLELRGVLLQVVLGLRM
jgi:hypothetical protein